MGIKEGEQHAAPRLARLDFVLTKCEDVVPEFGETWKLFCRYGLKFYANIHHKGNK